VNKVLGISPDEVSSRQDNERYRIIGDSKLVSEFGPDRDVLTKHRYVFHIISNGVQSPIAACVVMGEKGYFAPGLYRMGALDEAVPVEIVGSWDSPPIQLKFGFFDDYYDIAQKRNGYHNEIPSWISNQPKRPERIRPYLDHRQLKFGYQDVTLI